MVCLYSASHSSFFLPVLRDNNGQGGPAGADNQDDVIELATTSDISYFLKK